MICFPLIHTLAVFLSKINYLPHLDCLVRINSHENDIFQAGQQRRSCLTAAYASGPLRGLFSLLGGFVWLASLTIQIASGTCHQRDPHGQLDVNSFLVNLHPDTLIYFLHSTHQSLAFSYSLV